MRHILHLALSASCLACLAAFPAMAAPAPAANQELENPLEPLVPQKSRTEEEDDRLTAVALFSTARTLEQRHQSAQALRKYERALRYDPKAYSTLREMVPLAFSLNRPNEALRYAAKFAEQNPIDAELLRYSAAYLAESGDWKNAINLYQQVEQATAKKKPNAEQVLLQMDLGRLYFLTEKYANAADEFQHVMEALDSPSKSGLDAATAKDLLGEGGATYELIGNVLLEAKRSDDAKQAFERLDKIKPDPAVLALNLARVEFVAGHSQQALDELQKYFDAKSDSKGVLPYELLTSILKDRKEEDKLIPQLETLHAAQPENAPLAYYLGDQYRQAGKLDDAQKLLEAALEAKPSIQTYHALTDVYCRNNQPAALLKLLAAIVEKQGTLALSDDDIKKITGDEKLLSAILETAQKQHAAAEEKDYFPLYAAALLAVEGKRWTEGEALVDLAIKAHPKSTVELLTVLGLGLMIDEKYSQAAAVLQKGIDDKKQTDDDAPLYYYLAGALELQNKTDDALAAAQKAAEKRPKDPRFVARPAWILYHAKRYDDAAKAYQQFVDQFDGDYSSPEVRENLHEARSVLSNIAEEKHDSAQAVEWLEQILDESPDDPGANNDLGFLWADQNQHLRRAYRMVQLAVADSPDNVAYRDSLGWVLYRLNRYSEAVAELQKAAEGDNPDGEILNHLGDAYQKLGQPADAKSTWTRALEAFKKDSESAKIKEVEKKLANNDQ